MDLILRVAQAYFDVLLAQDALSLQRRRKWRPPGNSNPPGAI